MNKIDIDAFGFKYADPSTYKADLNDLEPLKIVKANDPVKEIKRENFAVSANGFRGLLEYEGRKFLITPSVVGNIYMIVSRIV